MATLNRLFWFPLSILLLSLPLLLLLSAVPEPAAASSTPLEDNEAGRLMQSMALTDTLPELPELDPLPPQTDPPIQVSLSDALTYTFTITNTGSGRATGVYFTDTLPESVIFRSIQTSRGECEGAQALTCTLGALDPGMTAQITIVVTPTTTGLISNTGWVGSAGPDSDASNNYRTKLHFVIPAAPPETGPNAGSSQPQIYLPLLLK